MSGRSRKYVFGMGRDRKAYTVEFRPATRGALRNLDGVCEFEGGRILIAQGQAWPDLLETAIHEGLHAEEPEWPEGKVKRVARQIRRMVLRVAADEEYQTARRTDMISNLWLAREPGHYVILTCPPVWSGPYAFGRVHSLKGIVAVIPARQWGRVCRGLTLRIGESAPLGLTVDRQRVARKTRTRK